MDRKQEGTNEVTGKKQQNKNISCLYYHILIKQYTSIYISIYREAEEVHLPFQEGQGNGICNLDIAQETSSGLPCLNIFDLDML